MRRPLLLAVLGLAAAGLAVLAIGLPSSDLDLPEASAPEAPVPAAPAVAEAPEAPAEGDPAAPAPPDAVPGADDAETRSPELVAHLADAQARRDRRKQPDAQRASSYASAWNVVQYKLSANPDPKAKDLAARIAALTRQFRSAYQAPDRSDLATLVDLSDAMKRELVASGLVDDTLRAQVEKIEKLGQEPLPTAGSASPTAPPTSPE